MPIIDLKIAGDEEQDARLIIEINADIDLVIGSQHREFNFEIPIVADAEL